MQVREVGVFLGCKCCFVMVFVRFGFCSHGVLVGGEGAYYFGPAVVFVLSFWGSDKCLGGVLYVVSPLKRWCSLGRLGCFRGLRNKNVDEACNLGVGIMESVVTLFFYSGIWSFSITVFLFFCFIKKKKQHKEAPHLIRGVVHLMGNLNCVRQYWFTLLI